MQLSSRSQFSSMSEYVGFGVFGLRILKCLILMSAISQYSNIDSILFVLKINLTGFCGCFLLYCIIFHPNIPLDWTKIRLNVWRYSVENCRWSHLVNLSSKQSFDPSSCLLASIRRFCFILIVAHNKVASIYRSIKLCLKIDNVRMSNSVDRRDHSK